MADLGEKLISKDASVADFFSKVKNLDHYDNTYAKGAPVDTKTTIPAHSFRPRSRSPVACPGEGADRAAIEMI